MSETLYVFEVDDDVCDEEVLNIIDRFVAFIMKMSLALTMSTLIGVTTGFYMANKGASAVGVTELSATSVVAEEHDGMRGSAIALDHVTLLGVQFTDRERGNLYQPPETATQGFDITARASIAHAGDTVLETLGCPAFSFPDLTTQQPVGGASAGAGFVIERAAFILGPPPVTVAATGQLLGGGLIGPIGAVNHKLEAAAATHQASMRDVELVLIPIGQTPAPVAGDDLFALPEPPLFSIVEIDSVASIITAVWGSEAFKDPQCPE